MNWNREGNKKVDKDGHNDLSRYLSPEDLYDVDERSHSAIKDMAGPLGAIILTTGESAHRIREPLGPDTVNNFGDRALAALKRTDLYLNGESN